jgi:hypothetical protein
LHEFGYSVSHDKIVDLGRTLGKNYKPLEKRASDDADLLSQVLAYICGKAAKFVSVAEDAGT